MDLGELLLRLCSQSQENPTLMISASEVCMIIGVSELYCDWNKDVFACTNFKRYFGSWFNTKDAMDMTQEVLRKDK
jgi:hypothetical protein